MRKHAKNIGKIYSSCNLFESVLLLPRPAAKSRAGSVQILLGGAPKCAAEENNKGKCIGEKEDLSLRSPSSFLQACRPEPGNRKHLTRYNAACALYCSLGIVTLQAHLQTQSRKTARCTLSYCSQTLFVRLFPVHLTVLQRLTIQTWSHLAQRIFPLSLPVSTLDLIPTVH